MKKNLPYFLVIAALVFLIIGVLSSGRENLHATTPDEDITEVTAEAESTPFLFAEAPVEVAATSVPKATSSDKRFNIYADGNSPDNNYSASGWMGDSGDININEQHMMGAHSGSTCIKVNYSAKASQGNGWAGVYWQNPANNWGQTQGGLDLTGYNSLSFWARGEDGGEVVEKVKVGGITGTYPDSSETQIGPIVLTKEWKQYTINLVGKDLSYISGGFAWITGAHLNPNGAVFYLDDIRFENVTGLAAENKQAEAMPFDVYTERRSADNHFIPSGHMGDTADLRIEQGWTADPHSGTTCIKVIYSAAASQGYRWAGIYWQHPENNWGQAKNVGFDLSEAKRLSFWVRGEKGGERIEEFKVGGISGDYGDSDVAGIGPVLLTQQWKEYIIDLAGKDLSYIIGGFCFSTSSTVNPDGATFYLDDIRYE